VDNITHTLIAVTLSRAGLNRLSPHATALLVVAANAPDLDILGAIAGPAAYLHYHRGPTHSVLGVTILALLIAALAMLVARKSFTWGRACLLSLIGAASNPLLDYANAYGVRLLWPWQGRWFNADFIAIVDVWIWLLLGLGLVATLIARLVSSEIGAKAGTGRGMAVFVLCSLSLYGFGRYLLHERAVGVLDSRIYQNEAPLRVAAMPSPANPFRWTGLVEGKEFLEVYPDLNLLEEFDPSGGAIFYKPEPSPDLKRAGETEPFRVFLGFAQWPLWRVTPVAEPEQGRLVELMDLRFGAPENRRFVASALLDGEGRVVRSSFRF
jgi:inner membrane protein